MANREIWKFSKFSKGLNTGTDPKDIGSDEFAELVDCNVAKSGVIESLGHAKKSLEVSPLKVADDLIAGEGLANYFTDNTFFPQDDRHLYLRQMTWEPGISGTKASMQINTKGSLLWLFRGQPTGGTLNVSIQIENGSGSWVPIHGELDGSGSSLTVLKGATWNTIAVANPHLANTTPASGDLSLLNHYTYWHYPVGDGFIEPSEEEGRLYPVDWIHISEEYIGSPRNEYWSDSFIFQGDGNELRVPHRAGNVYEALSGSESASQGMGYWLTENHPNSYYSKHLLEEGDINAPYWWEPITENNDALASNDPRWIFGHSAIEKKFYDNLSQGNSHVNVDNFGHYAIGYQHAYELDPHTSNFNWWDPEQTPFDEYGFDADNNWLGYIGPYDEDYSEIFFPHPSGSGISAPWMPGIESFRLGSKLVAHSIWRHIIKAINAYSGSDATDQFTAKFLNYNYPKNDGSTFPTGNPYNQVPDYTSDIGDDIIITSASSTSTVNGRKLRAVLTAASVKPDDGSELIANTRDRDMSSGSLGSGAGDVHWEEYEHDSGHTTLSISTAEGNNRLLVTCNTSDDGVKGVKISSSWVGGSNSLVPGNTYKISANIWTQAGTMDDFRFKIGVKEATGDSYGFSDKFSITNVKTTYTRDIYYNGEDASSGHIIYIYHEGTSSVNYYIDDISLKESTVTFIGDDDSWYDTGMTITTDSTSPSAGDGIEAGNEILKLSMDYASNFWCNEAFKAGGNVYKIIQLDIVPNNGEVFINIESEDSNGDIIPVVACAAGQRIYKRRIHPLGLDSKKVNKELIPFGWDETAIESSEFRTKFRRYGTGFVHYGYDDRLHGGSGGDSYYTRNITFSGIDNTGDKLDISLEGTSLGGHVYPAGNPYFFNSSLSTDIATVIADINSLSGVSATNKGKERIHWGGNRNGTIDGLDYDFVDEDIVHTNAFISWIAYDEGSSSGWWDRNAIVDGLPCIKVLKETDAGTAHGVALAGASYTDETNLLSDGNLTAEQVSNGVYCIKPSTEYVVSAKLKVVSTTGNAENSFYFHFGGTESTIINSLTTSWATYSRDITTDSSIGSTDYLKIYNKNDYDASGTENYWYATEISIREKATTNEISIQSGTNGGDGFFSIYSYLTYYDINDLVSQGVSEEVTALVHKSGNTPGIWFTDPLDGQTYKETSIALHSKLANVWVEGFRDKLKWIYTTSGNIYDNIPIFWSEAGRLRISEGNFKLNNESKCIDYFDISNWFPGKNFILDDTTYYTTDSWSWDLTSTSEFKETGHDIVPNDKKWVYSTTRTEGSLPSAGLDTESTSLFWHFQAVYDYYPGMKCYIKTETSGGVDWTGTAHFYAAAVYDDGGESLPGHKFSSELSFNTSGDELDDLLRIYTSITPLKDGLMAFPDKRIVGIRFYYTHSEEGHETFWNLGIADFRTGFIRGNTVDTVDDTSGNKPPIVWQDIYPTSDGGMREETLALMTTGPDASTSTYYIDFPSMPKLETFESINGYSPFDITTSVRYKAHCIAGRRSFVGNIKVVEKDGIRFYNDRMIVSPVNQLDTYPYPGNVLDLDISDGDEIVSLNSVGDKVLQFKRNIVYVVNISTAIPSEFFVEERHKYKGVKNKHHVVETSDGVFWINEFGAYLYDGENVKNLHFSDDDNSSKRLIDETEWNDFISNETLVGFNPKSKECFVVKSHSHTESSKGDCYIYSLISESWMFGSAKFFTGGKIMTNIINIGDNSTLGYMYNGAFGTSLVDDGSPIR